MTSTAWCLTTISIRTVFRQAMTLPTMLNTLPLAAQCRNWTGVVRMSTIWCASSMRQSRRQSLGCASASVLQVWLESMPTIMASSHALATTGSMTASAPTRWRGFRKALSTLSRRRCTGESVIRLPTMQKSPRGGIRRLPNSTVSASSART